METENTQRILEGVVRSISESLAIDPAKVKPDSTLIPGLGADSLDFLDIIFSLEREFGIRVSKEEFDLLKRVNLKPEEAVVDDRLTSAARDRLRAWLPGLPEDPKTPVAVRDLKNFITTETIVKIVRGLLPQS